ncbi:hypothetical protein KP509_23G011500 [Ceratopteris richardii]|uniref:Uncharacterized protein n=1 Tax=Ceratopteris richardii TaxID=49495 RepID=A0A8T2RZT5_CERRI|nr:hypothetical protein KP509_23G011500 [Ceratopteris richardii]
MAMRAIATRLCSRRAALVSRTGQAQLRAYSDGKVLSEEERAQENMYIKKMEKEKLEKARQAAAAKGETSSESHTESFSGTSSSSIPGPSKDSSKNLAIFAGITGILAVTVWYARSGSKKEEVKS